MNNWLNNTLSNLMPGSCLLCDAANENAGVDLCADCRSELPYLLHACRRCSLPLPVGTNGICGQCLNKPPHFDHCTSLFHYAMPMDKLVQRLKFSGKLVIARTLGELFSNQMELAHSFAPQCIIPVPLHRKRLRQRGFNQALELARPVAKKMQIDIDKNSCQRLIDTQPQTELSAEERRRNLRHAFSVNPDIIWKRVILFDDVMTTGSTVNALAKALKTQGVEEIAVWCIARALPKK